MNNPFEDDILLDETRIREIVRNEVRVIFQSQYETTELDWRIERDTIKSTALEVILDVLRNLSDDAEEER